MRKFAFAVCIAMLVAGCQTQPSQEAPIDDRSAAAGTSSTTPGASTAGSGSGGVSGSNVPGGSAGSGGGTGGGAGALRDPNSILSRRSVFFDFDSIAVKDEFRPMIEAHARYLSTNRGSRATIQGHTDERGSREYNIALGQRRADAIKRMMTLVGAQDNQIETVSFGKEKPRNPGHDDASWAQNRRGDIVHQGE